MPAKIKNLEKQVLDFYLKTNVRNYLLYKANLLVMHGCDLKTSDINAEGLIVRKASA